MPTSRESPSTCRWSVGCRRALLPGLYTWNPRLATLDPALGEPAGAIYTHLVAALRSGDRNTIACASTHAFGRDPA
jgi:hypothetical protein